MTVDDAEAAFDEVRSLVEHLLRQLRIRDSGYLPLAGFSFDGRSRVY